jgi:hypothetical protein
MFFFSKLLKKNQKVLRKKRNKIVYPSHKKQHPLPAELPANSQVCPSKKNKKLLIRCVMDLMF